MKWNEMPVEANIVWVNEGFRMEKTFNWDLKTISLLIITTIKESKTFEYLFDGILPNTKRN